MEMKATETRNTEAITVSRAEYELYQAQSERISALEAAHIPRTGSLRFRRFLSQQLSFPCPDYITKIRESPEFPAVFTIISCSARPPVYAPSAARCSVLPSAIGTAAASSPEPRLHFAAIESCRSPAACTAEQSRPPPSTAPSAGPRFRPQNRNIAC